MYVDYTNKSRETAYVFYKGNELDYRFPQQFLDEQKDIIYSNGETEILEVKILIVHDIGTLMGGAEYSLLQIRDEMARRGHEVRSL